jgi:hypothetical protein
MAGSARLALNFVMNYEEGSEPSIDDGDEAGLTRTSCCSWPRRSRIGSPARPSR